MSIEIIIAIGVIFVAFINPVASVIISVVALVALGIYNKNRPMSFNIAEAGRSINEIDLKIERLRKLGELIDERGRITNDEAQRELGVSDATATNYLNELERAGKITQVGATGAGVYYKKNG